jgi:hypothetical protein
MSSRVAAVEPLLDSPHLEHRRKLLYLLHLLSKPTELR